MKKEYQRISKTQARKMYNAGIEFIIIPCKCNPYSPWFMGFSVINNNERDFDTFVNAFCYYNCNPECGKYPHFYVSVNPSKGGDNS